MRPFRISGAFGDSAEEIVVDGESTVPGDEGSRDAVALLRGVFGEPPYAAHLRCLRIMLKTVGNESSVADFSRLLQSMTPDQLHGIAALLGRELPPGKWNAAVRSSKVVSMLVQLCSAIFGAGVAATSSSSAEGRGDGEGGCFGVGEGRPSPSDDLSDLPRRSVPPSPAPSLASHGSRRDGETTDYSVRISGAFRDSTVPADCDVGGATFAVDALRDGITNGTARLVLILRQGAPGTAHRKLQLLPW